MAKNKDMKFKMSKTSLILSIILVAIIVSGAGLFYYLKYGKKVDISSCLSNCLSGNQTFSPEQAGKIAISNINKNFLVGQKVTASLISVPTESKEVSWLYKMNFKIGNSTGSAYITKDGKFLVSDIVDLTKGQNSPQANGDNSSRENVLSQAPKQERPDIKLFVMSYCPYGFQSEKAILPVYNLLKDKADIKIYFVDYSMHGKKELDENLRQYCVQKEERERYADYLSCFVAKGDYNKCLNSAGINKEKIDSCIKSTDNEYKVTESYNDRKTWLNGQFPLFGIYKKLNEKYAIQGSPTLVINDSVIVSDSAYCPKDEGIKCIVAKDIKRSPESIKQLICSSFVSAPKECSTKLSEEVSAPGFGQDTSNNENSNGQCK